MSQQVRCRGQHCARLISEGANAKSSAGIYWWLIVFPGALFTLIFYGLNAIGDGIRDAFDVQQQSI